MTQKNPGPISRTRRWTPLFVIAASTIGVGFYKYDQSIRPVLLHGPMVQMPLPDRLAVVWSAKPLSNPGWVRFTNPEGMSADVEAQRVDDRYFAEFSGLRPGRDYSYEVLNAGLFGRKVRLAGPHMYHCPPARGSAPFRFVAFGDSGTGGNSQAIVAELVSKQRPDVVIHAGDLIYPAGAKADYPLNFYLPYAQLIAHVPFMPCLGNHDVASERGEPFLREFVLPTNGPSGIEPERNYYFDFGDARFIALDTNIREAGGAVPREQLKPVVATWVRSVLKDCDAKWKFVYFHHPYYTGSQHTPESVGYLKDAFEPVFVECGVNAVFCGHNHLFERSAPIVHGNIVEEGEGIVYITTGAGGAERYPELTPAPKYIRAFNDKVFSFTCVDVRSNDVLIRQIDEHGKAIDAYTLPPRRFTKP